MVLTAVLLLGLTRARVPVLDQHQTRGADYLLLLSRSAFTTLLQTGAAHGFACNEHPALFGHSDVHLNLRGLLLQVSSEDCRRAVAALEQVLLDLNDAMGKAPGDAGYVNISATAGAGYGGAISY